VRQFDHAWRSVNADGTTDFRCEGEEVVTVAATDIEEDVSGPGPSQASNEGEPIFEQLLRVAVLLGRPG
jgi:hypothetical protein